MNGTFKCDNCGIGYPDRELTHRETMAGQYCTQCAQQEKCAACGEMHHRGFMVWKDDIRNYVCENCSEDYKAVADYIKPIYSLKKVA